MESNNRQLNSTQNQRQNQLSHQREEAVLKFDFNQELPIEKEEKLKHQQMLQQRQLFTKETFLERFEMRKLDPMNIVDALDMWYIIVHNKERSPFCNKVGNEFIMAKDFTKSKESQDEEEIKTFILKHKNFFLNNTKNITGDNNPNGKIGLYFLYDKQTKQNIGYTGFEPLEYKDGKIFKTELQVHILDGKFTRQGLGTQMSAFYRDNILVGKTNGEYNTTLEFDPEATYQRRTLKINNPSLQYQSKVFPWKEHNEEDGNCIKTTGSMATMAKYAKLQKGDLSASCVDAVKQCTAGRCEIF